MNLYEQRSSNIRRTWALILGFLVVVIAIGYSISWYYGNPFILYIAAFIAVTTNFYAYWQSDKLVLKMNHARLATREEFFDLYTVTENLAITAGLPKPKLYVIDDPAPNAFATGRDENHAVVCATTGLLALLTRPELEGVIAHELSHIQNRDILLMTVAVVLAGFVAIVADIFLRMSFHGGDNNKQGNVIFLILAVVGIILAPLAAKLIQFAVSRRREYLADASGALLTRYPEGLASALEKISSSNVPMRHANHATAHLFIDEPFGKPEGKRLQWLEGLFSTHPPTADRIKALLAPQAK
ncbi:zinc metalloprotease HtpX [Candidatus Kaiserbacteria bacterium]|nr:zinc metalloprotease HtpX [Candidatus Kaiserbacteria bacterium]